MPINVLSRALLATARSPSLTSVSTSFGRDRRDFSTSVTKASGGYSAWNLLYPITSIAGRVVARPHDLLCADVIPGEQETNKMKSSSDVTGERLRSSQRKLRGMNFLRL